MIIPPYSYSSVPQTPKSLKYPPININLPLRLRAVYEGDNIKYPPASFGSIGIEEAFSIFEGKKVNSWMFVYTDDEVEEDQVIVYIKRSEGAIDEKPVGNLKINDLKDKLGRGNQIVPREFTESVLVKQKRALRLIKIIAKNAFQDCGLLTNGYYSELMDPKHRYGAELNKFIEIWEESHSADSFIEYMNLLEHREIPLNEFPGYEGLLHEGLFPQNEMIPLSQVTYYTLKQASLNKLTYKDGIFSTARLGQLLNSGDKRYIFVVDKNYSVFVDVYQKGLLHHSSLIFGNAVLCAGELNFFDGKLIEIADKSGHYRTTPLMMSKGLNAFSNFGIPLCEMGVNLNSAATNRAEVTKWNALDLNLNPSIIAWVNYYSLCGPSDGMLGAFIGLDSKKANDLLKSKEVGSWLVRKSPNNHVFYISRKNDSDNVAHAEMNSQSLGYWQRKLSKTLWVQSK